MEYMNKAIIEKKKRRKDICIITFLGCVGCAAIVLAVYNIFKQHFIYTAIYAFACLLSVIYTVIKVNTVIPTFIADDEENIYMRYWANGFFPFRNDKGFMGEFIPEKIKNSKITLKEIKSICIGSGNFISRTFPESEFAAKFKEYKKKYSGTLKHTEFIHLTLEDSREKYMPVSDFDTESLANIVKDVQKSNKNMTFTTGNRNIRKRVPSNEIKFDIN